MAPLPGASAGCLLVLLAAVDAGFGGSVVRELPVLYAGQSNERVPYTCFMALMQGGAAPTRDTEDYVDCRTRITR